MPTKVEQEITKMHEEIEEIKEVLEMVAESYIENLHGILERDRDKFISLDEYNRKHGIRS
ncbi:MAG: hypothetical protein HYY37_05420 [Candidatus Aenigmarchaeota archaeon]|nr:hypothetical protein [Candidatus Aenigmarchaeota archaeon]